jgi:hypothetical protein
MADLGMGLLFQAPPVNAPNPLAVVGVQLPAVPPFAPGTPVKAEKGLGTPDPMTPNNGVARPLPPAPRKTPLSPEAAQEWRNENRR